MPDMNSPEATTSVPRLFVHWNGGLPRIGQIAAPNFYLICPSGYSVRPKCTVKFPAGLDHDDPELHPRRLTDAEQKWTFPVPFSLTTEGNNCRPGSYVIEFDVHFPGLIDGDLDVFFHCDIYLQVEDDSKGRTLVIEGHPDSIVNVHNVPLSEFEKVVIEAGPDAIVNMREGLAEDRPAVPEAEASTVIHEFPLAVVPVMVPTQSDRFTNGSRTEAATLVFDDGHRTLLFARHTSRWRWKLGRNRSNDVITRFLPRSERNDALSLKLSREQAELELTDDGLLIDALSSTGIWIDGLLLDKEHVFSAREDGHGGIEVGFGEPGAGQFRMDLQLLAMPEDPVERDEVAIEDVVYAEVLDQKPRQRRLARHSQLDAARLRRESTLEDREEYVLLFRQATVGVSDEKHAVVLKNTLANRSVQARFLYAGRRFWIENQGSKPKDLRINGVEIPPRELVPLDFGMELQLGSTRLTFEKKTQLEID